LRTATTGQPSSSTTVFKNGPLAYQASTTTTSSKSSSGYSGYGTSTYPTPDQGKPIDGGGVPCVN